MTLRQKICAAEVSTLREFICKADTGGTTVVYSREHSLEAEVQEHSVEIEGRALVIELDDEKVLSVNVEDIEVEKNQDKEVSREC